MLNLKLQFISFTRFVSKTGFITIHPFSWLCFSIHLKLYLEESLLEKTLSFFKKNLKGLAHLTHKLSSLLVLPFFKTRFLALHFSMFGLGSSSPGSFWVAFLVQIKQSLRINHSKVFKKSLFLLFQVYFNLFWFNHTLLKLV